MKKAFTPLQIRMNKENRRFITGFTLVELLIVIIIIGILATMAVPQYQKIVKKSKIQEAIVTLGLFRKAQMLYYAEHDFYLQIWTGPLMSKDEKVKRFNWLGLEDLDNSTFQYGSVPTINNPAATYFFLSDYYVDGFYCPNNVPTSKAEAWVGLGIQKGDLWWKPDIKGEVERLN